MSSPRETSRFFRVRVARITELTPSFRRFTFVGDDLHEYGDPGFDQRIKVVFPTETLSLDAMPTGPDWWTAWRELPDEQRLPFRTYTTRAVRRADREVDVDMVAHDVLGPASAWIANARVGDEVLVFAPTVALTDVSFGVDFVPPAETGDYLLAGDETAAPAIAVILEQLPADATGTVVLEVPTPEDCAYLPRHPGFSFLVAARAGRDRHAHLVAATRDAAFALTPDGHGDEVEEVDIDEGMLWEVPRTAKGGAALKKAPLYAWLAGEASAIKTLRRHLVTERGVDRRAVAFMGYWRSGRAEC
ncbi:siderophore-interacting protein [Microbacterium sp. 22296]|uniref:siderophore-interacting protein n=1 Tax=Microbacterium sp. 22296 TaxID=3453903 RepID=UPI003F8365C2